MARHSSSRPSSPKAIVALSLSLVSPLFAANASADEPFVGKPSVAITETSIFKRHFDNRDTNIDNDNYSSWVNRFNFQISSGRFTAALRLDSALFFSKPNPNDLAQIEAEKPIKEGEIRGPSFVRDKTYAYGRDLSSRYVNAFYPSKFSIRYQQRSLEVTVGDYYVQFGRGLVLSMRKLDEISIDTTLRGGKVVFSPDLGGPYKFSTTIIAGASNPLRVDDLTGRLLSQRVSGTAENLTYPLMPTPQSTIYAPNAEPNFAPDVILGAQAEGGTKDVLLGLRAIQLTRTPVAFLDGSDASPARQARKIMLAGASINIPSINKHGSFYLEAASQSLRDPAKMADPVMLERMSGGYAIYALVSAFHGPFTLSAEGIKYERYYPLTANISATEFKAIQYNTPPTTEPITADSQFNNFKVCVTGGRARLDVRGSEDVVLFATLGRYRTYSERSTYCGQESTPNADGTIGAPLGKTNQIRNDVWDPSVGTELQFEEGRSHVFFTTGVRVDNVPDAVSYPGIVGATDVYYREQYIRYDLIKKVYGPWSVETQGFHRYRYEPAQSATAWREGENYISAIYSPKVTVAAGYEYTTRNGSREDFYNALVAYRFTTDTLVRAFVGQTRPAIRCVSGVCRQFPAFEGAKIEATVNF